MALKLLIHSRQEIKDLLNFCVSSNYPKGFVRYAARFMMKSLTSLCLCELSLYLEKLLLHDVAFYIQISAIA